MGSTFRPKDFARGYTNIIRNSLKDLSPDIQNNVFKLLNSLEDDDDNTSGEKLQKILGEERMKKLMLDIKKYTAVLREDEKATLKNMFRDSLTFD